MTAGHGRAQRVSGLRVELSEPVLVRRSRRFCWFPSLIRQPDGTLWAVMSAYADVHVSDSFCYLSRSRDGGMTWDEPRVIGDAGLSHLVLPDGSALILPYYMRLRPGGAIGAPCNILSPAGEHTVRPAGVNVAGWPRPLNLMEASLGTAGFVFSGQVVRGLDGGYLTMLYGTFEGDARYSLVLAESADGFNWRIRALIAGADCPLEGTEGPCEAALCRLADGRLMCVFRLASFVPYGRTWSGDDGRTWTPPAPIAALSVEPSLETMPGGPVVLSGGRPGILVWLSPDGGATWEGVDIVAHHNACRPQDRINPDSAKAWLPRDEMRREGLGGFTSSYTELMRLDERNVLLIYDRLGCGWSAIPDESSETNSVWVVRITVGA